MSSKDSIKEKDLAYGGQALIEGVLMRGQKGYAFTVKDPNGGFYKEKKDYTPIGKKIKILGLPFFRGIIGLIENLILGLKILNKSGEIAFPEEETNKEKSSTLGMVLVFALAFFISLLVFNGIPYLLTSIFNFDHNNNPVLYNIVSGGIRLIMFFIYLVLISFLQDAKRLFGYHGAEHKTISTYEAKKELTVDNVKKHSRLHPRCGTSFVFIVFLITIAVFPLFNIFFNTQNWYNSLEPIPQTISVHEMDKYLDKIEEKSKILFIFNKDQEEINTDKEFFISNYNLDEEKQIYVLNKILTNGEKMKMKKLVRWNNIFGRFIQRIIHILAHILVGMPIVASISYEILKLSGKFQKNPIVKILVAPGLFFQLFTTREPDDNMIKAAILSLKMIIGEETVDRLRTIQDKL